MHDFTETISNTEFLNDKYLLDEADEFNYESDESDCDND